MVSGHGSRVAQGSWCDAKWVYHLENISQKIQRSVWAMGWSSILLVDNCVHIYSLFPPQFLVREGVLIFWRILQDVSTNSEYYQELWLSNVDHCGICGHLPHFLSPKIWLPNIELSFYQVQCSYQDLFCIAAVPEELVL